VLSLVQSSSPSPRAQSSALHSTPRASTSSVLRSMSPADRQREAERIHKERRSLTRQKDEKIWVPGGEKTLPNHSSGGKIYPSDNKYCPPATSPTSTSASVSAVGSRSGSARKVALKVKDLLSDIRDSSRRRAEEINRERTAHRLETLPSGER
jgi:hypothetical protein